MSRIITIEKAVELSKKLKEQGNSIVLVGGCFDVLHIGHIEFLKAAKQQGDRLIILLESDEKIRILKGPDRPINSQTDRALILSELRCVDYVLPLPVFETDRQYDDLTIKLKPDIIATTKGDAYRFHKERQTKYMDARVIDVIDRISNQSTTNTITLLSKKKEHI